MNILPFPGRIIRLVLPKNYMKYILKFTSKEKNNKITGQSMEKGGEQANQPMSLSYLYSEYRKEMINLETQHFKLNRVLLLIIGLWPLQQSNLTRLQFIFLSTILTTNIMFQVKHYFTNIF